MDSHAWFVVSWASASLVESLESVIPIEQRRAAKEAFDDILPRTLVPISASPGHVDAPARDVMAWLGAAGFLGGDGAEKARVKRCVVRALLNVCRACDVECKREAALRLDDRCPYCGATENIETIGPDARGARRVCRECADAGGASVFITVTQENP